MSNLRDEDAEKMLISAMIADNTVIDDIRTQLTADDFSTNLGEIYIAFLKRRDSGETVDAASAPEELRELAYQCSERRTYGVYGNYLSAVSVASKVRRLRDAAYELAIDCENNTDTTKGEQSAIAYMEHWQKRIVELTSIRKQQSLVRMKQVSNEALQSFDLMKKNAGKILGVPTGFDELDQATHGLQAGGNTLICARTGVGKTAVMTNILRRAAKQGTRTLVYSYEMFPRELVQRMYYAESRVPGKTIEYGKTTQEDERDIQAASAYLEGLPIYFEERGTVDDIRAVSQRIKRTEGLDLLIVDHVGLVDIKGKSSNREQDVATVSRSLKKISMELNIPVLVLCQLNRRGERHEEPVLNDVRESSQLEHDASVVIMIWSDKDDGTELNWKLAKNRNGPMAKGMFNFERDIQRVTEKHESMAQKVGMRPKPVSPTEQIISIATQTSSAWDKLL